jgi:hypothetical protein
MEIGKLVRKRALNACEAMVDLPRARTRCGKSPVEDHHMLTRSRGGLILDALGEIYHHLALCPWHHREAHAPGGYKKGLMMEGSVIIEGGSVRYIGSDEYLTEHYGEARPVHLHVLQESVRSAVAGTDARGDL